MPPLGSVHKVRLTYGDVTRETTAVEIYNGAITAVSLPGFLTDMAALESATDAITLGTRRKSSWIGDLTTVTNSWPTDKAAQREQKLHVRYRDDVTEEEFSLEIGTIDHDKLNFLPDAGDVVAFQAPAAHADIVAWVTAFEQIARSPRNDLNTVTVIGMRFVGVNS